MRFSTRAIRMGQRPDATTGSIIVPVYQTVNFVFDDVGRPRGYEYSRTANPTRTALEECLASLEEAKFGVAFGSGMAAVDGVLSLLRPGDHVVSVRHVYGGTLRLFEKVYVPRGISFSYVDGTQPEAFGRALRPETRLIWIETPANPLLQLVDVRAVAGIARQHGARLIADNTFASPYFQRPLTQGADVVLHSTTKYISGHSDVIGGAVLTNDEQLNEQFRFYSNAAGAVPGPWDCWLSLRGLKTLAVRMRQHEANARAIADYLSKHPVVQEVMYPGLPSHPQHELAKRQMDGFGAIVAFRLGGGNREVGRFVKALQVFLFAESLGGVESLVCHPATMSHGALSPQQRTAMGITDGTIRLSVGIEDVQDLIDDLDRALAAC
ncbi:MAG: aminotransferase class I/II-fold pyridoxal phosphate-dependent enzyme [Phycisphaerae bacterium]|nr:aminotransferase class I/II-fold pyridoxal phosphate-dependent enzyme [Phycisphaerae bacterium]